MDAPLPFTCRTFEHLRNLWATFQSGKTTLTVGMASLSTATLSKETSGTSFSTVLISTTTQSSAHSTSMTTSTTTNISEMSMKNAANDFLNISLHYENETNVQATTTTTTTITTESTNDFIVEKTLLVDESITDVSKVYVVVFVVVIAVIGGIVVGWAYIVYRKKKRNVNLPIVAYVRNQPVVIPDRSETPVNAHRSRIAELSRNFLPLNVSTNFSRFGRQEQQQQFPEVEIHDIKFMVPDFVPFPGFDIVEFRQILAGVRNRPLFENSSTHCNDPAGVFQFFPETDCLN